MKIFFVAGARPNFMKISPIVRVLQSRKGNSLEWRIVHTGQHYDFEMSQAFFDDLKIPKPDYLLDVGSGTHAKQTAKIMTAFEEVCLSERPDVVVVVGPTASFTNGEPVDFVIEFADDPAAAEMPTTEPGFSSA